MYSLDFRKIQNFGVVIICMKKTNNTEVGGTKDKLTWLEFDIMIPSVRIQHATTELTLIVLYCYWFKVAIEDIKNTEYV
jgi:hypothetical protein